MLFPLPGMPFPCGKLLLMLQSPNSQLHFLSDGHVFPEVLASLCHFCEAGIGAISQMRKQRPKEGTCPAQGHTVERAEVGLGRTQVLSLTLPPQSSMPDGRERWRGVALCIVERPPGRVCVLGFHQPRPRPRSPGLRPSPRTAAEPRLPDIYLRTPVLILGQSQVCSQPGRCQSNGRENWPPPPSSQPVGPRAGWGRSLGQSTASTLLGPAERPWD